ncbi:NUDIX hydrolase [Candidatus Curtissbacteria bacterium]|nr:NUDIX hydrolase [Candidatus Curtissbacteria bacterium]
MLARNEPCPHCGRYDNRGVTIDAIIIKNKQVLLIRRGKEPDRGLWGTPGGYVGWDESAEDAVRREVKEETDLIVNNLKLVGVSSFPKRHPKQAINIVYLVQAEGQVKSGDDALDAKWFDLNNLPSKMVLDHKQNIFDSLKLSNNPDV